jgi:F-type H+-transporting ATPase subunit c
LAAVFALNASGCDNKKKTQTGKKYMLAEIATQTTYVFSDVKTGVALAGAAIGIGCATAGMLVAMSRNPGMFGRILTFWIIGMALAEGWAVIAWFVVK